VGEEGKRGEWQARTGQGKRWAEQGGLMGRGRGPRVRTNRNAQWRPREEVQA
jgi:hypothetical protein